MAEKLDSLESFFSCQVCLEDFENVGKRVPRILPCSHTLCEFCITQLIQNNKVECPECRKTYEAENRENSFPQNMYLLIQIRSSVLRDGNSRDDSKRCEEHEKELNLFCREPGCQKPICVSCFDHHRTHVCEMDMLIKNLKSRIILGSDLKEDVSLKTERCVAKILRKKEELLDHINNIIAEVERKKQETTNHIDDAISNMNKKLTLLCSMKQQFESVQGMNPGELKNYQERFRAMAEQNYDLTDAELFWHPAFIDGQASMEDAVGTVTEITELTSEQKEISWALNENALGSKATEFVNAEKIKCTVEHRVTTNMDQFYSMAVIDDETVIICVGDKGFSSRWKLKTYNLTNKRKVSSVDLQMEPDRILVVNLDGISTLAVSYLHQQLIEFRQLNDLRETIHTVSVAPNQPRELCAMSPSVLVYVDRSQAHCRLHWVDCDKPQPESAVLVRNVTHVRETDLLSCCVQDGGKQILVFSSPDGIFAYNLKTEKIKWKRYETGMDKMVEVTGMTTDGRGHLFVTDKRSIQMFSVSDGQYLGCLIEAGDQDLWPPLHVEWCETSSSLIAAQDSGWKWIISVIHLEF